MDQKRINIHELAIEEPQKESELPFDPERDITDRDLEVVERVLEKYLDPDYINKEGLFTVGVALATLENVKIFALKKFQEILESKRTELEYAWNVCKEKIEKNINDPDRRPEWFAVIGTAVSMMEVFPERKSELGLDEKIWSGMKGHLSFLEENEDWDNFVRQAQAIMILFPQKNEWINTTVEDNFSIIYELLKRSKREKEWVTYITIANAIKVICPEKMKYLTLDTEDWKSIVDILDDDRSRYDTLRENNDFSWHAGCITVLAAKDVRITDHGLEVIFDKSKDISGNTPSLPETKKF